MDLNEKLAARRRELAREAERVKREAEERDAAAARLAASAIGQQKQREAEALAAAVKKRLAEQGAGRDLPPEPQKKHVDTEVEKLLEKAATDRMTKGENAIMVALVAAAIISCFIAWWLAVSFVLAIGVFANKTKEKYTKQILAEASATPNRAQDLKSAVEERFGHRVTPTPSSTHCHVCRHPVQETDSRCTKCFAQLT